MDYQDQAVLELKLQEQFGKLEKAYGTFVQTTVATNTNGVIATAAEKYASAARKTSTAAVRCAPDSSTKIVNFQFVSNKVRAKYVVPYDVPNDSARRLEYCDILRKSLAEHSDAIAAERVRDPCDYFALALVIAQAGAVSELYATMLRR